MEFQTKKTIYLQIADYICEQILLDQWLAQAKIPSVRELAVNVQVNPNTIMRTYAFLEEQGIIKTQRGIGYFVAENAKAKVIEFKKQEFLKTDLPQLFKSMALLNIDLPTLQKLYEETKHDKK